MMELVTPQTLTIEYNQYSSPSALPAEWSGLYDWALRATGGSYAPYSGFCVGAAVELADGAVVVGANQENVAYPSGMCAERVALYQAGALHPSTPLRRMAIVARREGQLVEAPVCPCGACCQALLEYALRAPRPVGVLMASARMCVELVDARRLLPFAFTSFANDHKVDRAIE